MLAIESLLKLFDQAKLPIDDINTKTNLYKVFTVPPKMRLLRLIRHILLDLKFEIKIWKVF